MREAEMNAVMNTIIFINTPLQRGVETGNEQGNRFNGFPRAVETVEIVSFCSAGFPLVSTL
jgi:hypothetical protein